MTKTVKKVLEYILVIAIFCFLSLKVHPINYAINKVIENPIISTGFKVDANIDLPVSPVIYLNTSEGIELEMISLIPQSGKIIAEFEDLSYSYQESFSFIGRKKFKFKPVFKPEIKEKLKKAKEVQLIIKVLDKKDKVLWTETKKVRFLSVNDMVWNDGDNDLSYLIASWVTPENPEIKKLLRKSMDYLNRYPVTDTKNKNKKYVLTAIPGYQFPINIDKKEIVLAQVSAMFDAIKDGYKVRYITEYGTGRNESAQYIKFPEEVLEQKSGICIETVVTLASAVEAAGMSPIIVLSDTHAILGVQVDKDSKEFIFLETTALTSSSREALKEGDEFYKKNNKDDKLSIIDIKKARENNIRPFD